MPVSCWNTTILPEPTSQLVGNNCMAFSCSIMMLRCSTISYGLGIVSFADNFLDAIMLPSRCVIRSVLSFLTSPSNMLPFSVIALSCSGPFLAFMHQIRLIDFSRSYLNLMTFEGDFMFSTSSMYGITHFMQASTTKSQYCSLHHPCMAWPRPRSVVVERLPGMREVGGSIPGHVKQKTLKFEVLLLCLALGTKELATIWPARSQNNGLGWNITAYPYGGVSVG